MSTNIADMGQFNILYHLNIVFDGGSRDVDQVMYWTLRVNITLFLTLTQTSLLWMMKRTSIQKPGVCPDHPSRLIHTFNDELVPTIPQAHNYSIY